VTDNRPTERFRDDAALREVLNRPVDEWGPITRNEIQVETLRRALAADKKGKRANIKTNLALAGVVLGIISSSAAVVGVLWGLGQRLIVAAAADTYATKPDLEAVRVETRSANRKLDWMIIKLVPNATPPSFEEGRGKDEPRR
jgi:hypothetical protein